MFSGASRRYLLKLLELVHKTYQSPLMWEKKKKIFVLDKSRRYKIMSYVVLLIDILNCLGILGLLILNHRANLSYNFTLFLLFISVPTVENIILDADSLITREESLQLMNTMWRLVQAPPGIPLIFIHSLFLF